jgi:hypothetical protein
VTTITPELAAKALRIPWTRYIPHAPHAHQHAFLWLACEEALYGGAAGGGKSDALLMAALQYVDQPGYAALLLRRTYKDLSLPGALMSRAEQWLAPTDAKWNGDTKTWTFPSGATLTFGYLQTSKDKFQYQGAEFNFVGFDEATQFAEDDYTYLFSRLRRLEGSLIPGRMRCASNPGGEGHEWVKRRFVNRTTRDERIFIPAQLADNPSLDQGAYLRSLMNLDAVTREQLLNGDWDVRTPSGREFFDREQMDRAALLLDEPWSRGFLAGTPVPNGKLTWIDAAAGSTGIYAMPQDDHAYAIFADVAGGISEDEEAARADDDKLDFCAAQVVDLTDGRIVCEFEMRTDADLYAADLARLGWLYRCGPTPALLAVEVNNAGVLTISKLRDEWGYPNLYRRVVVDERSKKRSSKLGWHTSLLTRPAMLASLKGVLRDDPAKLSSRALLGQMRSFVQHKDGIRSGADTGCHDDLVISAAGVFALYQQRAQLPVQVRPPRGPMSLDEVIAERQRGKQRKSIAQRAPRAAA